MSDIIDHIFAKLLNERQPRPSGSAANEARMTGRSTIQRRAEHLRSMKYKAFISYNHAADAGLAAALHAALVRFAKPLYKTRALQIFRDKSDVAAGDKIWQRIQDALDNSEFLILLACPQSANADLSWVPREIEYWCRHRDPNNILIVVTGGKVAWSDDQTNDFDWSRTTALPQSLRGAFSAMPLWLDLSRIAREKRREPEFIDAVATIASRLHGRPKSQMYGDDVRQHRLTVAISVAVMVGLSIAVAVASVTASRAFHESRVAFSRELAASAMTQLATDPELGLQLAIQSNEIEQTSQSETALRMALLKSRLRFAAPARSPVTAVAMTGDGGTALLGYADGSVDTLTMNEGRFQSLMPASNVAVRCISASTGGTIAVCDTRGVITLCELTRSARRTRFELDTPAEKITLSPDGTYLLAQRTPTAEKSPPSAPWTTLLTRASRATTAETASSSGRRVTLWHIGGTSATRVKTFAPVLDIEFGASGRELHVVEDRNSASPDERHRYAVYIWSLGAQPRTQIRSLECSDDTFVKLSPDASQWITTGRKGRHSFFDKVRARDEVVPLLSAPAYNTKMWRMSFAPGAVDLPESGITLFAWFSPDTRRFLTQSDSDDLDVWDTRSGKKTTSLSGHSGHILMAAFDRDGRRILTGSEDNTVRIWNAETGRTEAILAGHHDGLRWVSASGAGDTVLTVDGANVIRLWDAGPERNAIALRRHRREVDSAAFSPDSRFIVTTSNDTQGTAPFMDTSDHMRVKPQTRACVWEVETGMCAAEFNVQTGRFTQRQFRTVSTFASTDRPAGFSGLMTVLKDKHAQPDRQVRNPDPRLAKLRDGMEGALSPDNKYAITQSDHYKVRIFDLATGSQVSQVVLGTSHDPNAPASDPNWEFLSKDAVFDSARRFGIEKDRQSNDGAFFVSVSPEGTATVIDRHTFAPIAPLTGHIAPIIGAAFSPNGYWIATLGRDGMTILHPRELFLPLDQLLVMARSRPRRQLTPGEKERFLHK